MPYWSTLLGTAPPLAPTRTTYTEYSTIHPTEPNYHRDSSYMHDSRQHTSDIGTRLVYEEGIFDLSYDQQEGHNYDSSVVAAEEEEERHGRGPGHLLDMLPKVCMCILYTVLCTESCTPLYILGYLILYIFIPYFIHTHTIYTLYNVHTDATYQTMLTLTNLMLISSSTIYDRCL